MTGVKVPLVFRIVRDRETPRSKKPAQIVGFSIEPKFPYSVDQAAMFLALGKNGHFSVSLKKGGKLACSLGSQFQEVRQELTETELAALQELFTDSGELSSDKSRARVKVGTVIADPRILVERQNVKFPQAKPARRKPKK